MTTLFKAGDRVTVRNDLSTKVTYHMDCSRFGVNATYDMCKLAGKQVTIHNTLDAGDFAYYKINGSPWNWTDEMFEECCFLGDDFALPDADFEDFLAPVV